ncbi:MAG: response regulator [Opitutales bacterium]
MSPGGNDTIQVLLVEDNPGDVALLDNFLSDFGEPGFHFFARPSLRDAYRALENGAYALVLLDLNLPDAAGLEGLSRLRDDHPDLPVLVLTGMEDDDLAQRAILMGAYDFLNKETINAETLEQALRYTLRRSGLIRAAQSIQHDQLSAKELDAFQELRPNSDLSVTRASLGVEHLRERSPEVFAELAADYRVLLNKALEMQRLRIDFDMARAVQKLVDRLGHLQAGARDLIDLHTEVLREELIDANPRRSQAVTTEGRFLMIRALGVLVNFYRLRATGLSN